MTRAIALIICIFLFSTARIVAADGPWIGLRTAEFSVAGDVSAEEIRRVAERFDTVRQAVGELKPGHDFASPVPLLILVLRNSAQIARFKSGDEFFAETAMTRFIVYSGNQTAERAALREYARLLIADHLGPAAAPPWLVSGLAEYFSTLEISENGQAVFGAWNSKTTARRYTVASLLETDLYSFNRQTADTEALFREQSYRLVRTLLADKRGFRSPGFTSLIDALERGKPSLEAIEGAFGIKLGDSSFQIPAGSRPISMIARTVAGSSETLTETEARLAFCEIAYALGNEDALAGLTPSILSDPRATTLLGRMRAAERDFPAAEKLFERAIAHDPGDYRPYFALAAALVARESTELGFSSGFQAATAERVRSLLSKAIELAPRFGESYSLLAFVNSVRREDVPATIDKLKIALAIAPGNPWYQMRLAELRIADGDFQNARPSLFRLNRSAGDDRMRVYAENTLVRLVSLEQQMASLKYRRKGEVDGITDEPMSDEEIARRRERALIESLNAALRIPAPNEVRILGTIEGVECKSISVVVAVRTDDGIYTLINESVDNIFLTSYAVISDSRFGCGESTGNGLAVVTFRPAKDATTAGELVAVEFVPRNFEFLPKKN